MPQSIIWPNRTAAVNIKEKLREREETDNWPNSKGASVRLAYRKAEKVTAIQSPVWLSPSRLDGLTPQDLMNYHLLSGS